MASFPLYNIAGEKTGDIQVKDEVFNVPVNPHLIHSAVVAYLANQRRGQAKTKSRSEVSGGGAKPWKQKGTGRARAGSNTSPIWRRGGAAHGPGRKDYSLSVPKKVLKKALCSAVSVKMQEGKIIVVEGFQFNSPKTKDAEKVLLNLKLTGKTVIVMNNPDKNIRKSFRNINAVRLVEPLSLNIYDVMDCENLLISRESLEILEKRIMSASRGKGSIS